MARNALIQVRRDTAANWTSVNPTLAAGEMGYESDTGLFKIGDGSTSWLLLGYAAVTTSNTSTLSNKTLTAPRETWVISGPTVTGTMNIDVLTASSILWTANASGNWYFNFRGNSTTTLDSILTVGSSVTVSIGVTNGSTPRVLSGFLVDSAPVAPIKWQGGASPAAGNANSIDLYVVTIIKQASSNFIVLASMTKFA